MQAIVYTEYGAPDVLHLKNDVEKPTPKANELLIKVHATSVTTGDCNIRGFVFVPNGFKLMTRLAFGLQKPRKSILGVEFAGEVAAVGTEVTRFKVGDQVFGIDGSDLGAYAEYKCVSETKGVVLKPEDLAYEEAVALPNGSLTAYTFLKKIGDLQSGEKILIIGASGSIGTAAVQLAKHFGAEVTGVCSGRNAELVKGLGADHVIDYMQDDFTQNGKTYDIIFDTVGKSSFPASKDSLAPTGRYLASAAGIGTFGQMLRTSIFGKKKVLAGVSSESQEDLIVIKDLVEAGHLKPVIDRSYPMTEIVEAHRYVDSGRKRGNVVITING